MLIKYLILVMALFATTVSAQTVSPLDSWLDKLEQAERCNGPKSDPDNCKILDSNNRYSYSCLQFQADTFVAMSDKYDIHGSIYDCKVQKQIARAMILDNYNNWRHWFNSTNKIGKPPVVVVKVSDK